jgi:hypothetical protein
LLTIDGLSIACIHHLPTTHAALSISLTPKLLTTPDTTGTTSLRGLDRAPTTSAFSGLFSAESNIAAFDNTAVENAGPNGFLRIANDNST